MTRALRYGSGVCATLLASLTAACDGGLELTVLVRDPVGAPIAGAGVYVGDLQFDDALEAHVAGEAPAPLPNWFTDQSGRFEREFTVAGAGEHDFWISVSKEGFESMLEPAWRGDGAPESPVKAEITLDPSL